ncbi:hypothetical protein ACMAUO_09980 [Gluconacetobacter sp. Hr-1-5]|uniref:hypothetical protein n=1 Tax=Gluconacetobacter sp. Hr-1-5 TaxID=3395370 RepID=UPI003B516621
MKIGATGCSEPMRLPPLVTAKPLDLSRFGSSFTLKRRRQEQKTMFFFGIGGLISAVLFGLWLWIDNQAATEESPKGSLDAKEADAEFERTMKDIEEGK